MPEKVPRHHRVGGPSGLAMLVIATGGFTRPARCDGPAMGARQPEDVAGIRWVTKPPTPDPWFAPAECRRCRRWAETPDPLEPNRGCPLVGRSARMAGMTRPKGACAFMALPEDAHSGVEVRRSST